MCYILGKLFWYTRGRQFIDLYYAICVSFIEDFAPISFQVLVFAIFSVFCLIISSPFPSSHKQ